jgi:hypothetical protein
LASPIEAAMIKVVYCYVCRFIEFNDISGFIKLIFSYTEIRKSRLCVVRPLAGSLMYRLSPGLSLGLQAFARVMVFLFIGN